MNTFWTAVAALVPSIGVGAIFYFAMRFVVRADRNERANLAELDRLDAQAREGRSETPTGTATTA
ncbi:hypothetical protein SAMN05216410_1216 [Sanguibacter gelidistatuariae]|uniref:Uncharacterized protein n=1 Tax=Sanguibacter gelidistatuariae TaxID=1814289 RepID=A0A1G6HTW8_9MICO|nr:hypothetical protein [Sanguibacter gelidistatuariae]SDB97747.1 hypothetical protein SAMN05216410_1216 [Sanguibacter gelidistatuariae]